MARKALMLISTDEVVKYEVEAQQELIRQCKEETMFLKKQHDDIAKKAALVHKRTADESKIMWARLEAHLVSSGKLEPYDKAKHYLEMDPEAGVLYLVEHEKKEDDDLPDFLKAILKVIRDQ